jgi:hypothetical protein
MAITIRDFCEAQILLQAKDGRTDREILRALRRVFPNNATPRGSGGLAGYRSKLRLAGHAIPRKAPERAQL